MTPSDDRVLQLLGKWQKSLELHGHYVGLPEEQYWLVQPWPNHQRPTKWVVQLARQRVDDLMRIVQTRVAAGDPSLSEALELMSFLTNLVGSQHVERFIPLAEPENERPFASITMSVPAAEAADTSQSATREMPATARPPTSESGTRDMPARIPARTAQSGTREMPEPVKAAAAAAASRTRSAAARPRSRARAAGSPGPAVAAAMTPATAHAPGTKEVIADAARLLKWGRPWHELPDAIARLSGRPPAGPVREILKAHRGTIEQQALDAR